jgi:hypothetical protein
MAKNNNSPVVTGDQVVEALEAFQEEAMRATGHDGERARFFGFVIVDGLRECVDTAISLFEAGNFNDALKKATEARKWLDNVQRSYCFGATERHFTLMVDELYQEVELDLDLKQQVQAKFEAFKQIAGMVRGSTNVSLDEASKRYWTLEDTISRVKVEQASREENRKRRLVEMKRQKEEEDAERSRQAQAKANEEQRQARAAKAEELRASLSAM